MRDAMGGIFNLAFLAVFITVISGYLAFSVTYNRAFKVKNKAISILEQYQHLNDTSADEIRTYMRKIGYTGSTNTRGLPDDKRGSCQWDCHTITGICLKWVQDDSDSSMPKGYYSVTTAVDLNIPIFNKFLPFMNFFHTSGDTMTINASNSCT